MSLFSWSLSLSVFSPPFFFVLTSSSPFPPPLFLLYRCKHTGIESNGRKRQIGNRTKRQNHVPLPITQFLQIKAIFMNINVLESSTGPGDMTKREGKLPPYGQKGSVGPKNHLRDLVLICMGVFLHILYVYLQR